VREIARLLDRMVAAGVIRDYALFGAIAQMRYRVPVATLAVDVLVEVPESDRLDLLSPLYDYCAGEGCPAEGEAIRVEAWPLRFIPAYNALTREALAHAEIGALRRSGRVVATKSKGNT
jgi:hypothetical protein